jgi:hypothetical protein
MTDKKNSLSWVKYLIILFVIAAGSVLLFQNHQQTARPDDSIEENLARFYKKFSFTSRDPIKEQYGDSVILLEDVEASQTEQLVAIKSVEQPPAQEWSGQFKSRSFAQGTTIKTEAMKYAEQEGMQLIWDLNKDFVIRHRFSTENNLLGALDDLADAIDSSFVPEVNVYFCNTKRTIVISDKAGTYVTDYCVKSEFN